MEFDNGVNWPDKFSEYIRSPHLADPNYKRRDLVVATFIFLMAGLQEIEEQLFGDKAHRKEGLSLAMVPRRLIVPRAKAIAAAMSPDELMGARVGDSAFRWRWNDPDGMHRYIVCLIRYALFVPRWRNALFESTPEMVRKELQKVSVDQLDVAALVDKAVTFDMRLRLRFSRSWLFETSLTMDARWSGVASRAYKEFFDAYVAEWVRVYIEAMDRLGVRLRPGMDASKLAVSMAIELNAIAEHAARIKEDTIAGQDVIKFAVMRAQSTLYAALDLGDGDIGEALKSKVQRFAR